MVAFRSWDENVCRNTKKSSLYSHNFLIFIHKTPVVESHPTAGEIRELLWPTSTPTGITIYFYMGSSLIYITGNTHKKVSNIVSDEGIIENDYMLFLCYEI